MIDTIALLEPVSAVTSAREECGSMIPTFMEEPNNWHCESCSLHSNNSV